MAERSDGTDAGRQARRAAALRANLRRRKQAGPPSPVDAPDEGTPQPGGGD